MEYLREIPARCWRSREEYLLWSMTRAFFCNKEPLCRRKAFSEPCAEPLRESSDPAPDAACCPVLPHGPGSLLSSSTRGKQTRCKAQNQRKALKRKVIAQSLSLTLTNYIRRAAREVQCPELIAEECVEIPKIRRRGKNKNSIGIRLLTHRYCKKLLYKV